MSESKRQFESQRPADRLGDAPVTEEYHTKMVAIVKALDRTFNGEAKGNDRKVGFVVLAFNLGEGPSRCNFMSNGIDRKDVVVLMKEMIARFEGQPEMSGRA